MKEIYLIQALCFLAGATAHGVIASLALRNRQREPEETAFGILAVCFAVILFGHLLHPIAEVLGVKEDVRLWVAANIVGSGGLCLLPAVLAYWQYCGASTRRARRAAAALVAITAVTGSILLGIVVIWHVNARPLEALHINYDKNWLLIHILCAIVLVSAISWTDEAQLGGERRKRQVNTTTVLAAAFSLGAILASHLARSPEMRLNAATALYSTTVLFAGVVAYYTYRFPFVDIVIKRGAALVLAGVLLTLWYIWVLAPAWSKLPSDPEMLRPIATALLLLPAVWVLPRLRVVLNRTLDSAIFGRYDRAEAATELAKLLASSHSERELIDKMTAILGRQFGISSIEYLESVAGEAPEQIGNPFSPWEPHGRRGDRISVPVSSGELRFGTLVCGNRVSGQPYLSEDARFLRWAGDSAGAALQRIGAQSRERQLCDMAIEAKMTALRAQINPHFLFNTLNALASLVRTEPHKAEQTVERLAAIFSYALGSSERPWMTVGEELSFIESYLQIEKTRFEQKLNFRIDCPPTLSGCLIPPMILQPLVENAIKHGIGKKLEGGTVRVEVRRNEDRLELRISDTGPGFREKPRSGGHGHGLKNVTERLAKTYQDRCRFSISSENGAGTVIKIELPAVHVVKHEVAGLSRS